MQHCACIGEVLVQSVVHVEVLHHWLLRVVALAEQVVLRKDAGRVGRQKMHGALLVRHVLL